MNFIKNYNKSTKDKFQDAIDRVTSQYGRSNSEADKLTLHNLISSIDGLRAEEGDKTISPEEASRTLDTLIKKHIGGSRKKTRRSNRKNTRRRRK
jgi:hypothetical protein